jgi:hypothetical protein
MVVVGYLLTFNTRFDFQVISIFGYGDMFSVLVYHLQANFLNVCQQLENRLIKINFKITIII